MYKDNFRKNIVGFEAECEKIVLSLILYDTFLTGSLWVA